MSVPGMWVVGNRRRRNQYTRNIIVPTHSSTPEELNRSETLGPTMCEPFRGMPHLARPMELNCLSGCGFALHQSECLSVVQGFACEKSQKK